MSYRPSARQLDYFLALAETCHFKQAAIKCNVSQPTLSSQFKLLEDSLGTSLLERGTGNISLTAAGEQLLPLARQALESLDNIVAMAEAGQENLGGLIRLGVPPTFGPYFMPYLLPILKVAYPNLQLYIREDRPNLLEQGLIGGSLDCIITPDVFPSDRQDLKTLCHEDLSLAVPASHPLAGVEVIPVDMLHGERLLSLSHGFRLHDDVQALARAAGAVFSQDYEGTSLDALRQMVSIGMGLALFPASYIASEFGKEPDLVLKSVEGVKMRRTICVCWRQGSSRAEQFNVLFDLCRHAVENMQIVGIELADETS
ncbi:MAG: hydrogen peroxide-inducible genes activator [Roseibium sp.]